MVACFRSAYAGVALTVLGACATQPAAVRFLRPTVPAELQACLPRPPVPADDAPLADIAAYMLLLDEAGSDCRDKLAALSEVLASLP